MARGLMLLPMAFYKGLHRTRLAVMDSTQRALAREALAGTLNTNDPNSNRNNEHPDVGR
jgi:hypothetical protein